MAENEIDPQIIDDLMEEFRRGTLTSSELNGALSDMVTETTRTSKGLDQLEKSTLGVVAGVSQFTKTVAGGDTSISAMSQTVATLGNAMADLLSVVPLVGGVLSSTAKVATAVSEFALKKMGDSLDAFRMLSDVGALGVDGARQMREEFIAAGIPVKEYSAMLKRNAADLSYIYGSSMKGSAAFAKTMKGMMKGSDDYLLKLGFSFNAVADAIVDNQKLQRRLGHYQTIDQQNLTSATNKYGQELDEIARLTGQSKDDIKKQRSAMMNDVKFRAYLNTLDKKQQAVVMTQYNMAMKRGGKEAADQYAAVMTGSMASVQAQQAAVNGTSTEILKFKKSVESGDTSVATLIRTHDGIIDANRRHVTTFNTLYQMTSDNIKAFGDPISLYNSAAAKQYKNAEEVTKMIAEAQARLQDPNSYGSVLVKAEVDMKQINTNFDAMFGDSSIIRASIKTLSENMNAVSSTMARIAGSEDPTAEIAKIIKEKGSELGGFVTDALASWKSNLGSITDAFMEKMGFDNKTDLEKANSSIKEEKALQATLDEQITDHKNRIDEITKNGTGTKAEKAIKIAPIQISLDALLNKKLNSRLREGQSDDTKAHAISKVGIAKTAKQKAGDELSKKQDTSTAAKNEVLRLNKLKKLGATFDTDGTEIAVAISKAKEAVTTAQNTLEETVTAHAVTVKDLVDVRANELKIKQNATVDYKTALDKHNGFMNEESDIRKEYVKTFKEYSKHETQKLIDSQKHLTGPDFQNATKEAILATVKAAEEAKAASATNIQGPNAETKEEDTAKPVLTSTATNTNVTNVVAPAEPTNIKQEPAAQLARDNSKPLTKASKPEVVDETPNKNANDPRGVVGKKKTEENLLNKHYQSDKQLLAQFRTDNAKQLSGIFSVLTDIHSVLDGKKTFG